MIYCSFLGRSAAAVSIRRVADFKGFINIEVIFSKKTELS